MKVFVLGAGSLGRLVADIVESLDQYQIAGFFDDGYPRMKRVLDYDVLGRMLDVDASTAPQIVIAIGDPKSRKQIFEELQSQGFEFPSLVHPSVVLSRHCTIERGVIIGPNGSVLNGSTVKQSACILSHVNVNQDVLIGPYALIGAGAVIGNDAVLGEGCHIGIGCHIALGQKVASWTHVMA